MADVAITYRDGITPVKLGDRVWQRIWFRRHEGRVVYLPSVSVKNPAMEFNGLRWVGIRLDEGGFVSAVVDPEGQYLRNRIYLIRRDPDAVPELPPDEDPHEPDAE